VLIIVTETIYTGKNKRDGAMNEKSTKTKQCQQPLIQEGRMPIDIVSASFVCCSDSSRLLRCVYTKEGKSYIERMHTNSRSIDRCIAVHDSVRHIKPKVLNRMIRRIKERFAPEHPIFHACVSIPGMDISNPEQCRSQCIRALNRSGIQCYAIHGMEQGDNGNWHFHIDYQGSFRSFWSVYRRTGLMYHKFPNDRHEMFEIDGNKVLGFNTTLKYNLQKHHPNKRDYVFVQI
jgi:hypothetical protein